MTIQSLPPFYNMKFTLTDGKLTPEAHLFEDQTFQALNNLMVMFNQLSSTLFVNVASLSAVGINAPALIGINLPSFTTAQITAILAVVPSIVSVGTIWYNSTLDKLQFKGATAVQTITSV